MAMVYIPDEYFLEFKKRGWKYPHDAVIRLIQMHLTRPYKDTFSDFLLHDARERDRLNELTISELETELFKRYSNALIYAKRIEEIKQDAQNYVNSLEVSALIKKLNKFIDKMEGMTIEDIELRLRSRVRKIQEYDPNFNLRKHIMNIMIVKGLPVHYKSVLNRLDSIEKKSKETQIVYHPDLKSCNRKGSSDSFPVSNVSLYRIDKQIDEELKRRKIRPKNEEENI